MLTDQDIVKIIDAHKKIFYTREEAVSKQDFLKLEETFRSLQTSVDNLAHRFEKYYEEQKVLLHRVERLEEWAKKVAGKFGLELPF